MADGALHRVAAVVGRPGLAAEQVLIALVSDYNDATEGRLEHLSRSDDDADRVRTWAIEAGWYERGYHTRLPLHIAMSSKVSRIQQASCVICPNDEAFAPVTFPIGVPPWSHQSAPQVGRAFRAAVDANELYRERYATPIAADSPVCLRLVFVLEDGATMKDCDNMAKGLLDAFQGMLYNNDRQVEHLDLVKIHKAAGSPGYILVRLWPTRLNDHADVLTPQHAVVGWLGHETLDLERFVPT